jgi:hypothetical protein
MALTWPAPQLELSPRFGIFQTYDLAAALVTPSGVLWLSSGQWHESTAYSLLELFFTTRDE